MFYKNEEGHQRQIIPVRENDNPSTNSHLTAINEMKAQITTDRNLPLL
mgnify:CR=1 FL=1